MCDVREIFIAWNVGEVGCKPKQGQTRVLLRSRAEIKEVFVTNRQFSPRQSGEVTVEVGLQCVHRTWTKQQVSSLNSA